MKIKPKVWLGWTAAVVLLLGLGITAVLASDGLPAGVMTESGGITALTLEEAEAVSGPWSTVLGDLAGGYSLAMDSQVDKYLEVVTVDPALGDGDWAIYFDHLRVPDGFWAYWDRKGVNASATDENKVMWEILNGEKPIFYLRVSGGGTSFALIDGLAGSGPWRINGDHPLGTYHFGGYVSETAYLNLQLTLTKTAGVSLTASSWTIDGCGYLDVYIHLANMHDLYAVDIALSFNPAVLEVVAMDDQSDGVNLLPINTWFKSDYIVYNNAYNQAGGDFPAGTIRYVATQKRDATPVDETGDVAMIRFRAKTAAVSSPVTVTKAEFSDRDGFLVGRPAVYAAPAAAITTQFTAAGGLELDIIRLNASTVQLQWPKQTLDAGATCTLHKSKLPYFNVGDGGVSVITTGFNETGDPITFDDPVLGDVTDNYFYALQVVCGNGFTSEASQQVGKFEFELFETPTTDFSWIGLIFDNPNLVKAQDLGNHIKNNLFSGSVDVLTISSWNPIAQIFTSYVYNPDATGFDVFSKQPYRVEIDIHEVTTGSVIWAQVGRVPEITQGTYTLYETATTDFNWILQPLDMVTITNTTQLAQAIEANASGTVSVLTTAVWNPVAQLFATYIQTSSTTTRFGYPYRVEVDVQVGNFVTWPDN